MSAAALVAGALFLMLGAALLAMWVASGITASLTALGL